MFNIFDLIFPRQCVGCGALGSYICPRCQKTIRLKEQKCPECDHLAIDGKTHIKCLKKYGLDGLITLFENQYVMKKAIKTLKYRFITDICCSLVNLIPQSKLDIIKLNNQKSVIYPIPLHKSRLKWRGFNQAEKMAQILAHKLNLPLVNDLLIRYEKRIPQADIKHKAQRIENASGIFKLNKIKLPKEIILFDDVWTTGATIKEATKILKRGGVDRVWAVTLAR